MQNLTPLPKSCPISITRITPNRIDITQTHTLTYVKGRKEVGIPLFASWYPERVGQALFFFQWQRQPRNRPLAYKRRQWNRERGCKGEICVWKKDEAKISVLSGRECSGGVAAMVWLGGRIRNYRARARGVAIVIGTRIFRTARTMFSFLPLPLFFSSKKPWILFLYQVQRFRKIFPLFGLEKLHCGWYSKIKLFQS